MLTKEDIRNILGLINRTNLQGSEAIPVAVLLQKLQAILDTEVVTNTKKENAQLPAE